MTQSLQLAVSGIYTAPSDLSGLPPGALEEAINVECRYKNLLEPRRGFEELPGSEIALKELIRLTNFPVDGLDRIVALTDDGSVLYYNDSTDAWVAIPGFSTGIEPSGVLAKSRFIRGGQNLYLTTLEGVLSLASADSATMQRAGAPAGLNLEAATNSDSSGFFTNNSISTTVGTITSTSTTLSRVADDTGVAVGDYVSGTGIPVATTITAITPVATVIIQVGTTAAGSTNLSALGSNVGIVAGLLVSGDGITEGTTVVSIGAGPAYTVVLSAPALFTGTTSMYTFATPVSMTMSAAATASTAGLAISFYKGAQVAYRMVFGRVEYDIEGNALTRLGAPSSLAIATNTKGTSTNVTVTGTLPKNSSTALTFVQLYRSEQTESIEVTPLDQMQLVYERELAAGDFSARVITITDETPDSLKGIPLYTGTDREGILQANLPPPSAWDMCLFRDFALYFNAIQPATVDFTVTAVGSPDGIQNGDTITIVTSDAVTAVYTAASSEVAATHQFKVFSSGTPSQNITDTVNSLIRVINYDESLPVHAILVSSTTDLPGQVTLIGDNPQGTFTVDASAHQTAYDPTLDEIESQANYVSNGVFVSKAGELEAVPGANILYVGDSSSPIYRGIALRDYVVVLKGDGVYKILGNSPSTLTVVPFDLTTKIIGPDTAVSLNSGVWMLSNQGIVSISDAGVDAKSVPIDDQLNTLTGSILTNLAENSFAVGYESDRKYILCVPDNSVDEFSSTQHGFNYVTNCYTNWDRKIKTAFIHSDEGKLYISRADPLNKSLSKERKSGTYADYVDEAIDETITEVVSDTEVIITDVANVVAGDILYQDAQTLSPVLEIDLATGIITTQFSMSWATGAIQILKAYECQITWKQVFGDNPAFTRQFSEGLALFKNTRFNSATMSFITDFSQNVSTVELEGLFLGSWGLSPWGQGNWGGTSAPSSIRFLVPANKQYGSYIVPTLKIKQAWSNFKLQGLSLSYNNISQEVGK